MSIAGWLPKTFQFGGLGTSPQVAHADVVTASLAGPGTAKTAARSDAISATGSAPIVGEVRMVAFSGVPSGWLLCDGSAVSRTTYATLFAAIGTVWGVGDGSTTFSVPDLRGRGPIGSGTGSGLTARTLGDMTLGAETVTLATGTIPAHSHTLRVNDGSSLFPLYGGGGGVSQPGGYWGRPGTEFPNAGAAGINPAGTDSSGGSGGAHANMQPSAVVEFIIRAL